MGAKKILFMDLLRIITLEEINELTTKHGGEVNSTLTEMLERELLSELILENADFQQEGVVLPFKKGGGLLGLDPPMTIAAPVSDEQKHFVAEELDHVSTATFILQERKRLEKNHRLLKAKEILKLYLKEASVNIEAQKRNTDDLRKSIDVGILINKKQY